jgi:hypothetical protein
MDKNSIKSLLNQTFVNEAKVPGLDVTNKAKEESGRQNKKAIKDASKELSDYDKESKKEPKDAKEPVKFNYTKDSEAEYHQEMEIMNGQEMIEFDREPSKEYQKRAEEAIAGSSRMGNNPEWANVVVPGQGGDPTFGKKLVKAINASKNKRADSTPTSKMFGDDWEVVQDKAHKPYAFENKQNNKSIINENQKMKRLTFKKPFNGVNNALNLIPEAYRVANKVFEMTDGNESYRIRWEGSLNEGKAVVIMAADKSMVNEDIQKMKHLMGYKSQDTFGNLKGAERLNEDKNFGDIWRKSKTMLTEGMDEWSEKQLAAFDKDGDGTPFEKEDFAKLRKDEGSMYETGMYETGVYEMDGAMGGMSKDAERLDTMLGKNSTLTAAMGKINTKQELIDTMSMIYGDILQNNPQLVSSEMALIAALKEKGRSMSSQSPQMGMGESGMYETDRFDEVFSELEEDMNENLYNMPQAIGNILGDFRELFTKSKQIANEVVQTLTPEEIEEALAFKNKYVKGDPGAIISKFQSEVTTKEPETLAKAVGEDGTSGDNVNEGWWGDTGKRLLARFSGYFGAAASAAALVINLGATGYNTWGDSKFLTKVHYAIEGAGFQSTKWGGIFTLICIGLIVLNVFNALINWDAGKK